MASSIDSENSYELKDLQHSLRTASLELSLERSKHSVEVVAKDEEIRKLRLSVCLLQNQSDELHEQLDDEQTRSDGLEDALDEALLSLDEHKAEVELAQNQIRTQSREVANLKAELKAMEDMTSDSNKILSEKLALTREMSSLKPEVEHLRAQVESNQGLLAEKLSLQRQLSTLQVELENEKRSSARAIAKQGRKAEQDEDLRAELEELRKELVKEKKDRLKVEASLTKAEKAMDKVQADFETQQQATDRVQARFDKTSKKEVNKATRRDEERDAELDRLRAELEQERTARQNAEKAGKKGGVLEAELEALRQELEQEKRERVKAEKAGKKAGKNGGQQNDTEVEELRKVLEEEKRERKKVEKEYQKTLAEMQGKNEVLDDKLKAFREKLRSTKEKLKEKENQLEKAQSAAPPAKPSIEHAKPAKNGRKRMASIVEPDATMLGTPGDGFPAKKAKRATSVSAFGDTSNFSLTPFLNRKSSVAPGSPIAEEEEEEDADVGAEQEATPTALPRKAPKKTVQSKAKPLAPSTSSKANAKPRKKTIAPTLDMVTEESEHSIEKESSSNAPVTVPLKDADEGPSKGKTLVPKLKARKSLLSFAAFIDEPAAEKKKKRKLGAGASSGLGKTLFDNDEDEPPARPSGKGLFAARALGKSVLGKGAARPISGGYNMMNESNFTFSPLKKDRGNASALWD